eukprot:Protomagalhaensia_sp_Gyna_25__5866@NODE_881_length_2468_cov_101_368876_g695_i0_p1_GENE_NODE_881_length_2468_cov_101_368876_g695_i0NODE_881_length_2468_cov_101_368876_g695_i0_p1_ORF_typecomplete_len441_score33_85zfCCCH/PF00642_24/6e08zfCCCH/PF00642_24/0_0022zfCCCH/PF00642_24/4_1e08zfCCCH/PF00642_24/9_1e03zfCCCH_3/PF15663_5/1_3e08zfCCCH_3/PF15663_5/0_0081Torus/PF16131_5/0_02Torus/PF16131_5/0_74Torus/PF16131_5/0_0025zf_CCCH_4/PF18345_1/2_3e05zf_CCCH_4/PF18345_1/4_2e02zf_CCCH_4/PF18345_1/0_0023zfCCC
MSVTKRTPPAPVPQTPGCPKQPGTPRRPPLRLPLSARGPRKDVEQPIRGSQTERAPKEGTGHIEAFYKTRYCRYFTQQGSCWKGDECQFAHSESELRTPPDLTKTRMCAMFRLGYCKLSAEDCTFAHSLEDLKATDNFYKTEICSFWANGFCRAGEACRHAHGETELRQRVHLGELKSRKVCEYRTPTSTCADDPAETSIRPETEEITTTTEGEESLRSSPSSFSPSSSVSCPSSSRSARRPASSRSSGKRRHASAVAELAKKDGVQSTIESNECGVIREKSPQDSFSAEASQLEESASCHWGRKSSLSSPVCPPTVATSRSYCSYSPETGSSNESVSSIVAHNEEPSSVSRLPQAFYCVPSLPYFIPWPVMPPQNQQRRLVGIPVDDALYNEDLNREGFCLGVPTSSPSNTFGLPVKCAPSMSPNMCGPVAVESWAAFC